MDGELRLPFPVTRKYIVKTKTPKSQTKNKSKKDLPKRGGRASTNKKKRGY